MSLNVAIIIRKYYNLRDVFIEEVDHDFLESELLFKKVIPHVVQSGSELVVNESLEFIVYTSEDIIDLDVTGSRY